MEFVWWSWLVISAVLLIFEMMTGTFAFLIFAIGCAVTSIPAYFGLSLVWQIVLLAVVCFIVFLIFIRFMLITIFIPQKLQHSDKF